MSLTGNAAAPAACVARVTPKGSTTLRSRCLPQPARRPPTIASLLRTQGTRFVEETSLRGKEAIVEWFVDYFAAFREYEFKIEDVFEVGDWVVAVAPVRGVGRASGIELAHFGAGCYRFAGEKIVEFRTFGDLDAALSAVRA